MNIRKLIEDYIVITVGCFLLAIAIELFYLPHNLVTGGFSGLGIIIARVSENVLGTQIPVSVSNLALNLPLFIATFFILGFSMVVRSLYATVALSVSLAIATYLPPIHTDLFLAAVFGGVIAGVGIGLVIVRFGTTGGTELIALIIQKYLPHFNVSKLIFIIDCAIILVGLFAFGAENCMYAIISVFVCAKLIDMVVEGVSFAKVVYIITDEYEDVSSQILTILDRGVTGLESVGMYTGKQRVTLMTVIPVKEIPKLKEIVMSVDEKAFLILSEAREVHGEGFTHTFNTVKK